MCEPCENRRLLLSMAAPTCTSLDVAHGFSTISTRSWRPCRIQTFMCSIRGPAVREGELTITWPEKHHVSSAALDPLLAAA